MKESITSQKLKDNPLANKNISPNSVKILKIPVLADLILNATEKQKEKQRKSAKMKNIEQYSCFCSFLHNSKDICGFCELQRLKVEATEKKILNGQSWLAFLEALEIEEKELSCSLKQAKAVKFLLAEFLSSSLLLSNPDISVQQIQQYIDNSFNDRLRKFILIANGKKISQITPTIIKSKKGKIKYNNDCRRPISDSDYRKIIFRQGEQCYWCCVSVVRERNIDPQKVIENGSFFLKFRKAEEEVTLARATIDHLIRVVDGGTDDLDNLVISCFACNLERDKEMIKFEKATVTNPLILCCEGDHRFLIRETGSCSICGFLDKK